MTGITILLLLAAAVAALAPESPGGRLLHRLLVLEPARLLNRGPLAVLTAVIVVAGLIAFAAGAPEMIAFAGGLADFTLILDAAALFVVFGGLGWLRAVRVVVTRAARSVSRVLGVLPLRIVRASRRTTRIRRAASSRSDDEPEPFGAWAAA